METFQGRDRSVKFSSGAVESLYTAWVTLGRQLESTPDEEAVVDWIEDRIIYGSDGGRAFSLDPPTPELATHPRLLFLARLSAAAREAIADPNVDSALFVGVVWTEERRAEWTERLLELEKMLSDAASAEAGA